LTEQTSFREIRYNEKRRKILRNASRLFAAKGYEKASLEEIASKLKLTKASLYHYVKSKEDLLFQIQMQGIEEAYSSLKEVLESDLDPVKKIREAVKGHLRIITNGSMFGELGLQELVLSAKMKIKIATERERFEKAFQTIIQEGIEAGAFREQNLRIAVSVILGALHWVPMWYSGKGSLTIDEIAEETIEVILRGLKAPDNR